MSELPIDIIRYPNGLYLYNTKVFTEEEFTLAQNLGYIKTIEVKVTDLVTNDKHKANYFKFNTIKFHLL